MEIVEKALACLCSCTCPTIGAWLLIHPNTPSLHLSSFAHFFTTLCIPYRIVLHLSWCKCGHTSNDLGIHLLHCMCESERIATHDTLQDTIVAITSESGAHV